MLVRTFTGTDARDALQKVRSSFGPDAVILDTKFDRQTDGRAEVVVTAAWEPSEPGDERDDSREGQKSLHLKGEFPTGVAPTESPSDAHGGSESEHAPSGSVRDAIERIERDISRFEHTRSDDGAWGQFRNWLSGPSGLGNTVVEAFAGHLAESLPPMDPFLETRPRRQRILFVGARGVGRSTALFRSLAHRWQMLQDQPRLTVISAESDHGQERLAAWCARCSVPFDAQSADGSDRIRIPSKLTGDLLVEYVPGTADTGIDRMAKAIRKAVEPDVVVLVLPGTGTPRSWAWSYERYAAFRPTHLWVTHWDEQQPWWDVFALSRQFGLLPSYRGLGADPITGIEPFTAADLRVGLAEHLAIGLGDSCPTVSSKKDNGQ